LTSEGNTIENALSTGAFIEEYDIADLKKLIAETQNADIKLVYAICLEVPKIISKPLPTN
jgi:hypothetical protein